MPESQSRLPTFIVDCPKCKAKVAAEQHGRIERRGYSDPEDGLWYGFSVSLGQCPKCHSILVGESPQITVAGADGPENEWGDPVRVYPDPPKVFTSRRIPKAVSESITEGLKSLQASANVAACVMFGRALEAVCRNLLEPSADKSHSKAAATKSERPVMLGEGLRRLKDDGLIDQRLFDWSEQIHTFRNLSAHPTDTAISRQEAEDLRSFVFAIVEYVYDLTDRYNDFKKRLEEKRQQQQ